MTDQSKTTGNPGWLVATSASGVLLILALTYLALPWPGVLLAGCAAVAAFECGKAGARWHDGKQT
jgi:hypothetical protein